MLDIELQCFKIAMTEVPSNAIKTRSERVRVDRRVTADERFRVLLSEIDIGMVGRGLTFDASDIDALVVIRIRFYSGTPILYF